MRAALVVAALAPLAVASVSEHVWAQATPCPVEERSEAVDDAMVGHVEKMSEIIAQLVDEAGGEQYRCPQCGSFGPKASDHRSAGSKSRAPP